MRPLGNNIIIKADLEQKETLIYGTLKLVIPFKKQYNANEREGNPVLAEVVAENKKFPELKKGDAIILGHNSLTNPAFELFTKDNVRTLAIPVDRWILGKLGDKGEFIPLFGNTVVKRLHKEPVSSIIITPDAFLKTDDNKMNILAVAPDVKHLNPGQTAICHKYSDYEAVFSVNGEEHRVVIVWNEDVVAHQ